MINQLAMAQTFLYTRMGIKVHIINFFRRAGFTEIIDDFLFILEVLDTFSSVIMNDRVLHK